MVCMCVKLIYKVKFNYPCTLISILEILSVLQVIDFNIGKRSSLRAMLGLWLDYAGLTS